MALDPRLTIVMPLKGRPHFTVRWLMYADRVGFPYKIIFADGSDETDANFVFTILQDRSRFPKLDYEYIRFPFDAAFKDYFAKMRDSIQTVQSPFVVLADNDDFFVLEGLQKCVAFMESNPDYIGCGGTIGQLILNASESYSAYDGIFTDRLWWLSLGGHRQDLNQPRAAERVSQHLASYYVTHYDVHKTEVLKSLYSSLAASDLSDIFLAELYTSVMSAASGKIKSLPDLFLMRQLGGTGSGAALETLTRGDAYDRMLKPHWSADFNRFLSDVSQMIQRSDDIDSEQAKTIVKKAFRSHAARSLPQLLQKGLSTMNQSFRQRVRNAAELKTPMGSLLKEVKGLYIRGRIAKAQFEMRKLCEQMPSLGAIATVIADKNGFEKNFKRRP